MVGDAFGLTGIFLLTAALAGIGMLLVATVVPTPEIRSHQPDALPARAQLRQVLGSPRLLRLDAGIFVLHLVLTAIFLIVPLTLEDLGLETNEHWWVYLSVMGVGFVAMLPLLIIGEKRRRLKQVMMLAVMLLGVAVALMGIGWERIGTFWLVLLAFFTGFNLLEALLPSLISKEAPAAGKGSAMGVYSTSQFMGSFVGGSLGGWLSGFAGVSGVIVLILLAIGAWLGLVITMAPPRYATSLALRLSQEHGEDPRTMREAFMAIPGVDDAVVLATSGEAWLKVDRQQFNEEALWQLPFVARQA